MADGADWKYYKEKCKVLLIFSQEECVFPYDCFIDDSALVPNSHPSCFPALLLAGSARGSCCLCCPPVQGQGQSPPHFLCVALQETLPLHGPAVQALIPNGF